MELRLLLCEGVFTILLPKPLLNCGGFNMDAILKCFDVDVVPLKKTHVAKEPALLVGTLSWAFDI